MNVAVDINLIIQSIEALVSYLLQLKSNGQLTDDDLDKLVANTNTETRVLIKQALTPALPPSSPTTS